MLSGRQWGMHEDWRKIARAEGGHAAWKLLEAEMRELSEIRRRREHAFDKTKAAIGGGKEAKARQDYSSYGSASRSVWDTKTYRQAQRRLEEANEEVRAQEDVVIDLLEAKGLHLTLQDALKKLRPHIATVAMNCEVDNIREVLESVLKVLVDLSDQERATLLLCPRLPQFSMHQPSRGNKDRFMAQFDDSSLL